MNAIIQLEDYLVTELSFKVNESFFIESSQKSSDNQDLYDFEREILCNDANDKFIVRLLIRCNNDEGTFETNLFKFNLELRGIFSFSEEVDEKLKHQLVLLNSVAILYGIARGIVSQNTANMPCGRLILPTINFSEYFKPNS